MSSLIFKELQYCNSLLGTQMPPYLLLVAFASQHDKLHGIGDVRVSLADAWLSLLQLTLQLQRNGDIQLVHLHRLAATLLK